MSSLLADIAAGARRDLELRRAARERRQVELTAAERYARDPLAWLNSGNIIIASRVGEGIRARLRPTRLELYPGQEQLIAAHVDLARLADIGELAFTNAAAEKSRQIGGTWAFAALYHWAANFHTVTGLCMHRKLAEIDDGGQASTQKSLFGKIRYIDMNLDRGRLPFLPPPLTFKRNPSKVESPRTGAVIYGEGQDDSPGRGGTFDFVLVDEAAFVEHGDLVFAAVASACPNGMALLSTVNGDSNIHARICDEKPQGWNYLRLHWSQHPVYGEGLHVAGQDDGCDLCEGNRQGMRWSSSKPRCHRYPGRPTSPWYDQEVIGKTDEHVANELDIDRERALAGRVYSEFETAVHVDEQGVEFVPGVPVELAIDYGLNTCSVLVIQQTVDEVRVIGCLEMGDDHGTSGVPEEVARELRLFLQELGMTAVETGPDFTRHLRAIGDPAGHARSGTTGRPYVAQWRRQGFNFGKPPHRLTMRVDFGIIAVKRLLLGSPKMLRVCGVNAESFAVHMRNHVWPTDAVGRRRPAATDTENNIHTHACDAFRYWAVATFPPPDERTHSVPSTEPEEPEEHPLTRRRRRARAAFASGDDEVAPLAGGVL